MGGTAAGQVDQILLPDFRCLLPDGGGILPLEGFHKDTLNYTYLLPKGVSEVPEVTFEKADEAQKVLSIAEGYV